MNLSQALKILLVELELNMVQFATEIGVTPQYLSIINTQKSKTISKKTLESIEKRFGYKLIISCSFIDVNTNQIAFESDSAKNLISLILEKKDYSIEYFCEEIGYPYSKTLSGIIPRNSRDLPVELANKINETYGYKYSKHHKFIKTLSTI